MKASTKSHKTRARRIKSTIQKIAAWLKRRQQIKAIRKKLLTHPIGFITRDDKRVKILSTGIANVHGNLQEQARPIVFVFVDSQLLQFYKSTGTSGRKGTWLPFETILHGHFVKFQGHPGPTRFPAWVEETSKKIQAVQEKGLIK